MIAPSLTVKSASFIHNLIKGRTSYYEGTITTCGLLTPGRTGAIYKAGARVERFTYPVPTFGALAGVLRSIYAKPSFYWVPRRLLILKPIRYQNILVNEVKDTIITKRPFVAPERRMQKMQTYLYDLHYIVEAHFEWSGKHTEDEDMVKHMCIFDRSLDLGGRRDVFLGTRECSAIVEPMNTDIKKYPARERFDRFAEVWRRSHQGFDLHVGIMFHTGNGDRVKW